MNSGLSFSKPEDGLPAIDALVSVIIVNYNAGPLLKTCVLSTLMQCSQIIVVDNASTDGSLDALDSSIQSGKLLLIRNKENLGFAKACNVGTSAASGRYLLFLNPDCVLEADTISRLVATFENETGIGMVGGLLLNPDGTEQAGGRRAVPTPWRSFVSAFGLTKYSHRWPKLFFNFNLHEQPLPSRHMEVEAISGACMLVRREALKEVGLLDEGYFMHCEDLDWCMRFRRKGWKILFVPDAKVIHSQGTCSKSRPIFVEWQKHKGMVRFYRKFFRRQYSGLLMGLIILGVGLRFCGVAAYYGAGHVIRIFHR
jgi:GT2 family glycosyltransferase